MKIHIWNLIFRVALYLRLRPQVTLRQLHPPINRKFSNQRFMAIVPLPYRKKIYYRNYWTSIFAISLMADLPNLYSAHHHIIFRKLNDIFMLLKITQNLLII